MNSEGVLSTGMTTSHGLGIQVSLDVNGELTSFATVPRAAPSFRKSRLR